ncbi:LysR family transcriptional regulator [Ideonella sp. B508-1]|uniref:LysR family transcriptional regulator n=1 Tax=Ideonella sp. B508-1 TaxID=137716 RepID=UPI0003B69FC3|nr:LysR family transcriptional regulator [Ideonella sp. B508-1]
MEAIAPSLLDPKLLRLFDALYATRSVTRSAELLGLSQPTLSIWLRQMRVALDDALFVRTAAGMTPTPRAQALVGPVREVLEALRRLVAVQPAFDPATAQRRFRICMTDASHVTLLPALLARVRALAPQVRLEAAEMNERVAQALAHGEADLALGFAPWLSSGIYQQTLYAQDWICLASAHHPRLRKTLSLARYRAEAHITITGGTGQALLEKALSRQGIERRVLLELPGFLGLGAVVSSTDLLVTLPRHIGETLARANGLAVFRCPIAIEGFHVKQHWHVRYHDEPGHRWLRGLVAELFTQADRGHPAPAEPAGSLRA